MHRSIILIIAALLTSALWAGCGGGGGSGPLPQKSATMTFGTTSSNPAVQLGGVSIAVVLPAGANVATEPGTNQISAASLQGVGVQVLGSYSAPIRKVKIGTLPGNFPLGSYAKLVCDVLPGVTLAESDFTSITPLDFQPTDPQGNDLNTVQSSISVIFGY